MTQRQRFFLFTLIIVQIACAPSAVKPLAPSNPPPQVQAEPPIKKETLIYPNKPATVVEKPVIPKAKTAAVETKNFTKPPVSAAVQSLMVNAQKNIQAGNLDAANVTLERALRISPRNAELTYQLAALRLQQSRPDLAETLAKKAIFLAADDVELKKRCWELIAKACDSQGHPQDAEQARLQAEHLK